MNILALDLGTTTGWATNHSLDDVALGQFQLATKAEVTQWRKKRLNRRKDPRFDRLRQKIEVMARGCSVVIFEDVEFSSYTYQAQLWPTLRAAVWSVVPEECLECVPVKTLKKFATGSGGADKDHMLQAMMREEPDRFRLDKGPKNTHFIVDTVNLQGGAGDCLLTDDAVDAYWLYRWALEHIKR